MLQSDDGKDDDAADSSPPEIGPNGGSVEPPLDPNTLDAKAKPIPPFQQLPSRTPLPQYNTTFQTHQSQAPLQQVQQPYLQHPMHPQIGGRLQFQQPMSFPPHFMGPPAAQNMKPEYHMPMQMPRYPNPNDHNRMNNSNIPQSLTDILSWLFSESPPEPTPRLNTGIDNRPPDLRMISPYSSHSSNPSINQGPPLAPQYPQIPRFDGLPQQEEARPAYQEDRTLTPFYHNGMTDSVVNVGLQDLNFFLNNDNPLDEVFLKPPQDLSTPLLEGGIVAGLNWQIPSTVSSSSPTNTSGSLTPHTIGEHSPQSETFDAESMEKRLEIHAAKFNIAKNKHYFVNDVILNLIFDALPGVSLEQLQIIFSSSQKYSLEDRISFYIYGYWEVFHPRFSILHKPSFDTTTCQPLLLLSMLLIGSMYCATSQLDSTRHKKCPEFKLCMLIAKPLRFTLFQHEDFKSPVEVWILQSMNMLEWCEKNYLLRVMHERAHIHHGTTVQLLRRSPFLGGNPTVANKTLNSASETASAGEEETSDGGNNDVEETNNDRVLFNKWVNSESMKRVTFMTFYLDVIDYIKFRHNPQIPFFQLQLLNLPCDEDGLWNSDEVNGSFRRVVKRQRKLQKTAHGVRSMKEQTPIRAGMNFLSALKKLMKPSRTNESNKTSTFTKYILFGGLISIMHQMQQTDLQNNFSLLMTDGSENSNNHVWKEVLTKVLDTWEADIYAPGSGASTDPFFNVNKWQCKYPMYHLAQIIGMSDVNHYDIAIFGGSPANMSVDATSKDLAIVQRKLNTMWMRNLKARSKSTSTLINLKSVVHSYWLLWGLMLSPLSEDGNAVGPQLTHEWRVDHDYYDSMYAVSIATLVLWCYAYSMHGTESARFSELETTMLLEDLRKYEKLTGLCSEDGYQYIYRIRQSFTQALNNEGLLEDYVLHSAKTRSSPVPLYTVTAKYCDLLPTIPGIQNISGLCFLVGTRLLKSQWEVIRENAKLIINCGLRSVGKKNVYCPDLFENEFDD